jgi:hypothetical protein
MHASPNVIRAAEWRRQDLLAQAAYERMVDDALAVRQAARPQAPSTTRSVAAGTALPAFVWRRLYRRTQAAAALVGVIGSVRHSHP